METIFFIGIIWFFSYAFMEIMGLSDYRNDLYYGDSKLQEDLREAFYFDYSSAFSGINVFKRNKFFSFRDKIATIIIMPLIAIIYGMLWITDRV